MADSPTAPSLAAAVLRASRRLVILTGAGISAESGVPTFRGAGGYWRNRSFMELATPEAFAADPRLVWDWYLERRRTVRACEPNAAHRAIAAWSQLGRGTLITQNVDGLHERAGTSAVVRFHGSLWHNRCGECREERLVADLEYPELPRSPCCHAPERPGVVWFGEAIPSEAVKSTELAVAGADAVLVIGTSGAVYPAAGIVAAVRSSGAKAIEVNPEDTSLEVDVALRMPAAEAVPRILPSR
ncbi:MAG: NAD-dependent deacylase [Candidatus Eisenbacteria bacterium]|nr:NAD-dependent deacylase [Candidatus Eisenbacteria bacterium]